MSDVSRSSNSTVVLAQCTSEKRSGKWPAKKLYDESAYFRKQRNYAEQADKWYIQSAKYGLVHPEWEIESYDVNARDLENPDNWAREIALDLDERIDDDAETKVLGGEAYSSPLVPHLEEMGYEVHTPLAGMKIGERLSALDNKANASLEGFA
jgi:hypothetical protein